MAPMKMIAAAIGFGVGCVFVVASGFCLFNAHFGLLGESNWGRALIIPMIFVPIATAVAAVKCVSD